MLMLSPARSEMRTRKRDLIFPLSGASKKARFYKKHAALTNLNLTRGAVSRSVMPTFSRPCSFIQLLTIFRFRSSPSYSISAIKARGVALNCPVVSSCIAWFTSAPALMSSLTICTNNSRLPQKGVVVEVSQRAM